MGVMGWYGLHGLVWVARASVGCTGWYALSWASYDGVVASGSKPGWRGVAIVIDYHVELKTSNPYGEVIDGWIKLRTPLIPVSLSEMPENDENAVPHRPGHETKGSLRRPIGGYPSFDRI